jgi:hypothetical protein
MEVIMKANMLPPHGSLSFKRRSVAGLSRAMGACLLQLARMAMLSCAVCASAMAGTVARDVPDAIDANAKYLCYMHGLAIGQGGQRARSYEYSAILKALAERGFVVIGEEHSRVTNDVYAKQVASQVRRLLAAGVPAQNITVAGHSKGA